MKLHELARILDAECVGDPETEITGVAGIEEAGPTQVTFVANPRYAALAKTTQAGAIIVAADFPQTASATLRTKNPYLAFARAVRAFYQEPVYAPAIHPTAVVHPTAVIGRDAHIGPYAVIMEGAVLGDHATILPHVVLYPHVTIGNHFFAHAHAVVREGCKIGDHVTLQNGAIIGADGFGFAKNEDGNWEKIVQSGPAVLEDQVEVQSNATVDRASVGETHVGKGVKIDNLAQVGHGSSIGENTLLCAQVGLAGSSDVGKNVILAGQVGLAGHCKIGDGAIVTAQSGVAGDVAAGKVVSGTPAYDNRQWLRSSAIIPRLSEIVRELQRATRKQKEEKR